MGFAEVVGWVFIGAGLIILAAVLFTLPTYFLWNWLMPAIFELKKISLLQALGLNILVGILFRGSCKCKKD